ncbi:hypothetical protein ACFL01_02945, partial [Planctomycetota bacterium]
MSGMGCWGLFCDGLRKMAVDVSSGQVVLETGDAQFGLDPETHRLVSFRANAAPEQEFIASRPEHPVFVIQYLDEDNKYRQLTSLQASSVSTRTDEDAGFTTLIAEFRGVGGLDLDVTTRAHASDSEPLSRWTIGVRNGAGIEIVQVEYPYVVCAYDLGGAQDSETVLLPEYYGQLIPGPLKEKLESDGPEAWQVNQPFSHYPGGQFAQFMAYYNDRAVTHADRPAAERLRIG